MSSERGCSRRPATRLVPAVVATGIGSSLLPGEVEGEGGSVLKGDLEGDVLHVVAVVVVTTLEEVEVEENDDMEPQELLLELEEGHDDSEAVTSVAVRRSGVTGAVGGGVDSSLEVEVSSRR
jgi:hypothetical protein